MPSQTDMLIKSINNIIEINLIKREFNFLAKNQSFSLGVCFKMASRPLLVQLLFQSNSKTVESDKVQDYIHLFLSFTITI